MDIVLAICAIASGLSSIIYVLDYFGIISVKKATSTSGSTVSRRPSGGLVILLLALTWVAVGFDYYDRHLPSIPRTTDVLTGWGSSPPDTGCTAEVDGSKLSNWRDKYAVALVCGVNEASIDRLYDKRFTISSLYTIVSRTTEITTPYSKPMSDAMTEMKSKTPQTSKNDPILLSVWYAVVLLPRSAPASQIVELSDVTRCGGVILEGYADAPQI